MRAFRLDKSTQGEQRLGRRRELGLAREQNEERAAALAMRVVSGWGGARVGVAISGPAFFRALLVQQTWYIFLCTETEKEPENGGTRGISCRRDRSGSLFKWF